jgi:hypothetical protein
MPEFEKVEFEFPDEIEAKAKSQAEEVEAEEPETEESEIEIIDDTPLKGKSTEENVDPATEEELEQINSKRVLKRMQQLNRGLNHERQVKESALQEKEEALRIAKAMAEENKRLKGSLSEGEKAMIEQAKRSVLLEVESAKKKYKEAYDTGDTDALIAAQEELTSAKIKADKINNFKPKALQEEDNDVKIEQQQVDTPPTVKKDSRAAAWHSQNQWFGQDEEMTSFALGVHQKLVKSGIDPRSDNYYDKLNARIKQVFPDQFAEEDETEDDEPPRQKKSNVVAPVTRNASTKKVTLTSTQVAIAKKLGVPLELYAKQLVNDRKKNV